MGGFIDVGPIKDGLKCVEGPKLKENLRFMFYIKLAVRFQETEHYMSKLKTPA